MSVCGNPNAKDDSEKKVPQMWRGVRGRGRSWDGWGIAATSLRMVQEHPPCMMMYMLEQAIRPR